MKCLPTTVAATWLGALLALAGTSQAADLAAQAAVGRLNDTGIGQCEDALGNVHDRCAGSPQDAGSGRDVRQPADADGHLGFQFEKLDVDGAVLPVSATQWSCVHDLVTGLVWEMKTDDGGLHDKDLKLTHYGDGRANDTSTFVAAVNQERLCGRADWRLPTRGELQGIVDYSASYPGPTIDAAWFPYSDAYTVWTATAQVGNSGSWYVNFLDGYTAVISNGYEFGQARAVSGAAAGAAPRYRYSDDGSEVLDTTSGLVWQRCSVGQSWDGAQCTGTAEKFNWQKALDAAQAASAAGTAWRVPNVKELASLLDDTRIDPALDPVAFPGTPSELYWSSSPYLGAPFHAWTVYAFDGSATNQVSSGRYRLRLVRAGR